MQLIECPWCGPREETEFHYGGEAHVAYPDDPQALTDEQWAHYVFFRSNPKGLFAERWTHSAGCRRWFNALRDTATYRFHRVYRTGRAEADDLMNAPFRTTQGGRIDRNTSHTFIFNDRELTGHAGDTLASALLAHGVHQVTTSIKLGRPRGFTSAWAEDTGGLVQIEHPFPEPMLLGDDGRAVRRAGGARYCGPGPPRRDPRHRQATTRPTYTPTCWSPGPGRPVWPPP